MTKAYDIIDHAYDVVIVGAVERRHVQRDAGVLRERLKPLPEQLGVHFALVALPSLVHEGLRPLHGLGHQSLEVVDSRRADVRHLAGAELDV